MEKAEVLDELHDSRQELLDLLDGLPDETLLEPGVVGGWSIKDILAHLTYWEGQTVTMLFQVARGVGKPTTVHFGKETVDALNQRWFEAGKDRALDMIWQDWTSVRAQTIRRVSEMSKEDLFDAQRFPWMKGEPLWSLIASDTVEHEEEHADSIREWLDQRDAHNNGHQPG
jgi:hypothetical protein